MLTAQFRKSYGCNGLIWRISTQCEEGENGTLWGRERKIDYGNEAHKELSLSTLDAVLLESLMGMTSGIGCFTLAC